MVLGRGEKLIRSARGGSGETRPASGGSASVCDSPCSEAALRGRNGRELPGLQAELRSVAA